MQAEIVPGPSGAALLEDEPEVLDDIDDIVGAVNDDDDTLMPRRQRRGRVLLGDEDQEEEGPEPPALDDLDSIIEQATQSTTGRKGLSPHLSLCIIYCVEAILLLPTLQSGSLALEAVCPSRGLPWLAAESDNAVVPRS